MIVTDLKQLRLHSKAVKYDDPTIVAQLKAENSKAWTKGCGLAAVQIGIYKRIAWLKIDNVEEVLINPEIIEMSDFSLQAEGCLSIPNKRTFVKRANKIVFLNNGQRYEAQGFRARVIQHEIDHMDGILNIDRAEWQKTGRNEPCPECLREGIKIKFKNCKKHYH